MQELYLITVIEKGTLDCSPYMDILPDDFDEKHGEKLSVIDTAFTSIENAKKYLRTIIDKKVEEVKKWLNVDEYDDLDEDENPEDLYKLYIQKHKKKDTYILTISNYNDIYVYEVKYTIIKTNLKTE